MSFIAINAKADVAGSKKGRLTPAQNAQLNAFCLSKKTGVLDCLGRCGTTASTYSVINNVATVVFNNGYVVICGRLVECESQTTLEINTQLNPSGKIILRYNLANSGEDEFMLTVKNGTPVTIDLNDNPTTGIYEYVLYNYTTTGSTLSLTRPSGFSFVKDIGGLVSEINNTITNNITGVGKPLYQYDQSKGTIEERLTELGFKTADISVLQSAYMSANNSDVYQLGKVNYGKFAFLLPATGQNPSDVNMKIAQLSNVQNPYGTILIAQILVIQEDVVVTEVTYTRLANFYWNYDNSIWVDVKYDQSRTTRWGSASSNVVVVVDKKQGKSFIGNETTFV